MNLPKHILFYTSQLLWIRHLLQSYHLNSRTVKLTLIYHPPPYIFFSVHPSGHFEFQRHNFYTEILVLVFYTCCIESRYYPHLSCRHHKAIFQNSHMTQTQPGIFKTFVLAMLTRSPMFSIPCFHILIRSSNSSLVSQQL